MKIQSNDSSFDFIGSKISLNDKGWVKTQLEVLCYFASKYDEKLNYFAHRAEASDILVEIEKLGYQIIRPNVSIEE